MSKDTIYREDAIMALRLEYPMMPMFKELREEWAIKTEGYRKAEEVIMQLPSADRQTEGEWKKTANHTIVCVKCNAEFTDDIMDACLTSRLKYPKSCPICRARMKGADDEVQ